MSIEIVKGDLTRQGDVEAIVNAATRSLLGGVGVDGAIHRAAGPELLAECRTLNGCATGEAKLTGAYRLPCRYVIHTVGPIWQGGGHGEAELLAKCYQSCIRLASEHGIPSVAFPSISTGAYRYPLEQAAAIAVGAVKDAMAQCAPELKVRFVLFDDRTYDAYRRALDSCRKD